MFQSIFLALGFLYCLGQCHGASLRSPRQISESEQTHFENGRGTGHTHHSIAWDVEESKAAVITTQDIDQRQRMLQAQAPPPPPTAGPLGESSKAIVQAMDMNFGNVWEPFVPGRDTPYFWQIPRSGSTNALAYFAVCLDLTEASHMGKTAVSDKLEVVEYYGFKFINVDVSVPEGLKHAKSLNFAASHMADVVSSSHAADVGSLLFDSEHNGKMFSLLRHPIDRLASKFYYLQTATHEKTYNPIFANMTLEEYAQVPKYLGDNWMTRMLVGKPWGPVDSRDVDVAGEILRKKCLVGLQEEMSESLERFEAYFGWKLLDTVTRDETTQSGAECKRSFLNSDTDHGNTFNSNRHPKVDRGSRAWDLLAAASQYDLELYKMAADVFVHQTQLFKKNMA